MPATLENHQPLTGNAQRRAEGTVADPPNAHHDAGRLAHRVIDQLTATKLRVASLRLNLRQGTITSESIEETLAQIEHEIEAAAALAQDLRAREAGAK